MKQLPLLKTFPPLVRKAFLSATLLAVSFGAVAQDNEDANDTSAGALAVTAPQTIGDHAIEAGDADWFRVNYGLCNNLEVFLSFPTSNLENVILEIYTTDGTPQLISATITNNLGLATLSLNDPVAEEVFVKVDGNTAISNEAYVISFDTTSVNAAINAQIRKTNKKIAKMEKKLKRSKGKAKRSLKKKIKKLEKKLKVLESRLCA